MHPYFLGENFSETRVLPYWVQCGPQVPIGLYNRDYEPVAEPLYGTVEIGELQDLAHEAADDAAMQLIVKPAVPPLTQWPPIETHVGLADYNTTSAVKIRGSRTLGELITTCAVYPGYTVPLQTGRLLVTAAINMNDREPPVYGMPVQQRNRPEQFNNGSYRFFGDPRVKLHDLLGINLETGEAETLGGTQVVFTDDQLNFLAPLITRPNVLVDVSTLAADLGITSRRFRANTAGIRTTLRDSGLEHGSDGYLKSIQRSGIGMRQTYVAAAFSDQEMYTPAHWTTY